MNPSKISKHLPSGRKEAHQPPRSEATEAISVAQLGLFAEAIDLIC
jgi:hypothetical protein